MRAATSHDRIRRGIAGSGTLPAPGALRPEPGPTRAPLGRVVAGAGRVAALLACGAIVLATLAVLVLTAGPRVFPYRTYAIDSGSMAPLLPVGSEVILRPVRAERLRVGDVITFRRPEGRHALVTHRIVRIERHGARRAFVTKGDANAVPDAWRVPASGAGWRYAFRVPYAGYAVQGLTLPWARLGLVALIALVLAATAIRRIWSPAGREP